MINEVKLRSFPQNSKVIKIDHLFDLSNFYVKHRFFSNLNH